MQGVLLLILLLVGLSILLFFVAKDYWTFKANTDQGLSELNTGLTNEEQNRMANLKYVVDQVNTVNKDIYNTISSNVQLQQDEITGVQTKLTTGFGNLDRFFMIGSNVSVGPAPASAANMRIFDLPGSIPSPDLQLINHVSTISGVSIRDINTTDPSKRFEVCDPTKCIKIPDENGNTYLTGFGNGNIVLDAPTTFHGPATMDSPLWFSSGSTSNGRIVPNADGSMSIDAGLLGVGSGITSPAATLHVSANQGSLPQSGNVFNVSVNGTNALTVDGAGNTTGSFKSNRYTSAYPDTNLGVDLESRGQDGASPTTYQGGLASWWGIGFRSKLDNNTRFMFDTRTGNMNAAGSISAGNTIAAQNQLCVGSQCLTQANIQHLLTL